MDKITEITNQLIGRLPTISFKMDDTTRVHCIPYGGAFLIYSYKLADAFSNPVSADNSDVRLAAVYVPNRKHLFYIDLSDFGITERELSAKPRRKNLSSFAESIRLLNCEVTRRWLMQDDAIPAFSPVPAYLKPKIEKRARQLAFDIKEEYIHEPYSREAGLDFIAGLKSPEEIESAYRNEHFKELCEQKTIIEEAQHTDALKRWEKAIVEVIKTVGNKRVSVTFFKNDYHINVMMYPQSLRNLALGMGLPTLLLNRVAAHRVHQAGLDGGMFVSLNLENIKSISFRGDTVYDRSQFTKCGLG